MASELNRGIAIALVIVCVILLAMLFIRPGGSTGFFSATGTADVNVTVISAASIVITAGSDLNLGALYPGDSNSTESGPGVILENNGTIDVNITASSDAFFSSTNLPGDANALNCKASASGGGSAVYWQSTYISCYDSQNPKVIGTLDYSNSTDEARIDMNVTVPTDEPAGLKQGQVTFTASAS